MKNYGGHFLEAEQDEYFFWISRNIYFQNGEPTKHRLCVMDVQLLIQEHKVKTWKFLNKTSYKSHNQNQEFKLMDANPEAQTGLTSL